MHTLLSRERALALLRAHICEHLVSMRGSPGGQALGDSGSGGMAFFHQTQGIPQGSVLSSLLCNFYYAHMERVSIAPALAAATGVPADTVLGGGGGGGVVTALMRMTDDFLLLTTSESVARAFADVRLQRCRSCWLSHDARIPRSPPLPRAQTKMHAFANAEHASVQTLIAGVPEYGVTVNARKTRVNFEHSVALLRGGEVEEVALPRFDTVGDRLLLWCGLLIDTSSLEVTASHERCACLAWRVKSWHAAC